MPIARSEIVVEGAEGYYHCISRCVRRAFLCGRDPYSGRDFEHRKTWVRNRLKKLAKAFGIEVCAYAVMSNHLHLVVRTRPDWVESWSDLETARRWNLVFPKKKDEQGRPQPPSESDLKVIAANKERLSELRRRLGSLSWFMRCLNENIARRANHEDGCKGRFWEGRFQCQALLDESAVLACMSYVDLNPVRAGLTRTPEEIEFTSVFERIRNRKSHRQNQAAKPGAWLCPISDEHGSERRGLFEMTVDEYLEIIDWTGRRLRTGSAGAIPSELEPILTRLGVSPATWSRTVAGYGTLFQRVAGRVQSIRAAARCLGGSWFWGLTSSRRVFRSD